MIVGRLVGRRVGLGLSMLLGLFFATGCQPAGGEIRRAGDDGPRVKPASERRSSAQVYIQPPATRVQTPSRNFPRQIKPALPPTKPLDATNDDRHPSRWRRKLKASYA